MVTISSVGKQLKYICKPTKGDSTSRIKEWEIYCIKDLLFELKVNKYFAFTNNFVNAVTKLNVNSPKIFEKCIWKIIYF